MNWTDYLLLVLAGAGGGFLSGLLGVGGGIVFVPILDIVFTRLGIPQQYMVPCILSNSLFIIIFTGLLNSRRQYINKNYFGRQVLVTGLGGLVTSLGMSWVLQNLVTYNKDAFNIVFAGLLTPLILKMMLNKSKADLSDKPMPADFKFTLSGLITGFFTALSGLGGGLVMIPLFTDFLKVDIKKATSISAGTVPILALPLTLFYMWEGRNIDLPVQGHLGFVVYSVSLAMLVGVLFTVSLGVNTSRKLPSHVVKKIFAGFSLLVLGKMMVETLIKWLS